MAQPIPLRPADAATKPNPAKPPLKLVPKLTAEEREFLPATIELIETPFSPTLRLTSWALCGLITVAILWASLSHIDMVAVADGKVVPLGQVKVVQPLETAMIRAIHVDEGDHVTAGQPLVDLDPTEARADLDTLTYDRTQAALDAEVARVLLTRDPDAPFHGPDGADPELVEQSHSQAQREIERHLATIAGFEADIAQKDAALEANDAQIERAELTLPLLQEKNETAKGLYDKQYGTSIEPRSWHRVPYLILTLEVENSATGTSLLPLNARLYLLNELVGYCVPTFSSPDSRSNGRWTTTCGGGVQTQPNIYWDKGRRRSLYCCFAINPMAFYSLGVSFEKNGSAIYRLEMEIGVSQELEANLAFPNGATGISTIVIPSDGIIAYIEGQVKAYDWHDWMKSWGASIETIYLPTDIANSLREIKPKMGVGMDWEVISELVRKDKGGQVENVLLTSEQDLESRMKEIICGSKQGNYNNVQGF